MVLCPCIFFTHCCAIYLRVDEMHVTYTFVNTNYINTAKYLVLTTFQTNSTMKILIMSANKIEATFTAVERLCEYSKVRRNITNPVYSLSHEIFYTLVFRDVCIIK